VEIANEHFSSFDKVLVIIAILISKFMLMKVPVMNARLKSAAVHVPVAQSGLCYE
jgi:hypothetical protein